MSKRLIAAAGMLCALVALSLMTSAEAEAGRLAKLGPCCPPEPTCCAPAPTCCAPPPKVIYPVVVCNPCTGCKQVIELCIPACCEGCPKVAGRRTLIGAGLVKYTWCCGYTAVVRFDKCGNFKVRYIG